jgi:hypothetical protein
LKRHWPLAFGVAVYLVATAALLAASIRVNGGRLVYPLDDTYVHMAIARNVALHHVWGVTRYAFSSSTSSPLWTLLLAMTYTIFGPGPVAPLAFNLVAGTLIVVTLDRFMRARSAGPMLRTAILLAAIFLTPLPTLTLIGMEHTLHALTTLWFVFAAAALLASNSPATTRDAAMVGLLGVLVTGFRYEGVFTVCVAAALFALRRRWRLAVVVAAAGALPIGVYGLWSAAHGWNVLPNSVLLKGQAPALTVRAMLAFLAGSPALHALLASPPVLLLIVAALVLLLVAASAVVWNDEVFLLSMLIGTALLHMQLARVGWFYRYEAYLILLGIAVLGAVAADRLPPMREWVRGAGAVPQAAAAFVLIAVAGFPFVSRGLNAWRNTPTAASNIYSQQYQMGLFLDRFYQGRSVAVNDIGAIGYLADVRLFDIYGLADIDVAQAKRGGRYNSRFVADGAAERGSVIAIISPTWLNEYGGVPAAWTKMGEWGVADNVVLGESAVSFYAVRDDERARLADHLRRFSADLPPTVMQAGAYTR